jgi:hypothetical protein
MPMKPHIHTGLGALTPAVWGDLVRTVDTVLGPGVVTDGRLGPAPDQPRWITAQIGAPSQISGVARWEYAWKQVRRNAAPLTTFADEATPPLSDTTPGMSKALNVLEAGNTASIAYGFGVSNATELTEHPGWSISPVPPGTVVHIMMVRDKAGVLRCEFCAPNRIDGECPQG